MDRSRVGVAPPLLLILLIGLLLVLLVGDLGVRAWNEGSAADLNNLGQVTLTQQQRDRLIGADKHDVVCAGGKECGP